MWARPAVQTIAVTINERLLDRAARLHQQWYSVWMPFCVQMEGCPSPFGSVKGCPAATSHTRLLTSIGEWCCRDNKKLWSWERWWAKKERILSKGSSWGLHSCGRIGEFYRGVLVLPKVRPPVSLWLLRFLLYCRQTEQDWEGSTEANGNVTGKGAQRHARSGKMCRWRLGKRLRVLLYLH